jgi:hypothetical protein
MCVGRGDVVALAVEKVWMSPLMRKVRVVGVVMNMVRKKGAAMKMILGLKNYSQPRKKKKVKRKLTSKLSVFILWGLLGS